MAEIHPTAVVEPQAELGADVVVGPHAVIENGAKVGDRCVLEYGAAVRRWTELGADNRLLPGAVLGGAPQHLAYQGEETHLRVGHGNVFGEYVTIHRASRPDSVTVIGDGNYFMAYSHVGHDCQVGNGVVMTNYAGLAGHCIIEDHALIAAYAGTHQGVRVGTMAMLGGGALCGQDVLPYLIVQGIPAQPRGLNVIGMQRRGVSDEVRRAMHQIYQILFMQRLSLPNAVARIRHEVPDLPEVRHVLAFIEASKRGIARRKTSD